MDPVQDTFNESVSSLLERKVRSWLSGVIEDMRRSSPVQHWIDSIPPVVVVEDENTEQNSNSETDQNNTVVERSATDTIVERAEDDPDLSTDNFEDITLEVPKQKETIKRNSLDNGLLTSTPQRSSKNRLQRDYSVQSEGARKLKHPLLRDGSLQSDASGSSGSSVLNVLGARKVDAESVLIALGFGPSEKQQQLQRIPDRFLVPSKLKGISTEQFIKDEQHSMKMHDCGIFGYRGLTGNPHVPPSSIVAKIIECLLQGESRSETLMRTRHSIADMRIPPPMRHRQRLASNHQ